MGDLLATKGLTVYDEKSLACHRLKLEGDDNNVMTLQLQKILANQELSAADVQRMRQKSEELKKALSKLEGQRDSLDEEIWEKEMSYARRHEQVS